MNDAFEVNRYEIFVIPLLFRTNVVSNGFVQLLEVKDFGDRSIVLDQIWISVLNFSGLIIVVKFYFHIFVNIHQSTLDFYGVLEICCWFLVLFIVFKKLSVDRNAIFEELDNVVGNRPFQLLFVEHV